MFFINPFIYGGPAGDYESIATVTVGSGGATEIAFTSIASTYQHLQVRMIARSAWSGSTTDGIRTRINGDTGSNYAYHELYGNGSSVIAYGLASQTMAGGQGYNAVPAANATASVFGGFVLDILDYASTSKTKTLRFIEGEDRNGAGELVMRSALWNSTSAITAVRFTIDSGNNFAEYSTAALYGIKAP